MVGDRVRGLHGEVVRRLGMRVIRGDYPPGSLIEPDGLEDELGVSKTVVREALRVLSAKGLVDSRQKRGTFVRERAAWHLLDTEVMAWRREAEASSEAFLADLSEVRALVEPAGARLAAQRRTDDDLREIGEALSAMTAAGRDAEQAVAADLRFHVLLLKSSHNELLSRMDVVIINALRIRDQLVHQPGRRWRDPVPDHRVVLDAVRQGDGDAASTAMTRLLASSEEDLRQTLSG
jgi:GntR family transcriptional regulator, galactonate operon transcriptional repressor